MVMARKTNEVLKNKRFNIGDYTYGVPKVKGYAIGVNQGHLKIGKYCSIATEVVIFLGGYHRDDWITTYPFMLFPKDWPGAVDIKGHPRTNGNVIIGNDVWLGHRAMIMSGVTIGDGAVVGAGSIVTKNVKPYEIVAGNPASHIRFRFSENVVKRLLQVKWWNWHPKTVAKHISLLCSSNPEHFTKEARERRHNEMVSEKED